MMPVMPGLGVSDVSVLCGIKKKNKHESQRSKSGDLIGFIELFASWAACLLINRPSQQFYRVEGFTGRMVGQGND